MKYIITVPIKRVLGSQYYSVEAKSADEAIEKYHADEAEYEDQEISVEEIGEPYAEPE